MLPDSATHRARLLVTVLVTLTLCLTILSIAPRAEASQSGAVSQVTQARRDDPPAGSQGADFPVLPRKCYDPYHPAPTYKCPILSYGANRPTVVLWGDSHAWQYLPAVKSEARARRLNLVLFTAGGCPPSLRPASIKTRFPTCDKANRAAYDYVTKLAQQHRKVRVLLGSYWAYYRIGYRALKKGTGDDDRYHQHLFRIQHTGTKPLFNALGRSRVPFDLIGQSATVPDDAPTCNRGDLPYQCKLPRSQALKLETNTRAWLTRLTDAVPGSNRYINAVQAYCNATWCRPRVSDRDLFYDQFHLGARFVATLGAYFAPSLDKLARTR